MVRKKAADTTLDEMIIVIPMMRIVMNIVNDMLIVGVESTYRGTICLDICDAFV